VARFRIGSEPENLAHDRVPMDAGCGKWPEAGRRPPESPAPGMSRMIALNRDAGGGGRFLFDPRAVGNPHRARTLAPALPARWPVHGAPTVRRNGDRRCRKPPGRMAPCVIAP